MSRPGGGTALELGCLDCSTLEGLLLGRGEDLGVLDGGFALQQPPLAVGELTVWVAQLLLAEVEGFQPALDLGLPAFELAAKSLLVLRGADALGLDLLGDALLAVAGLGSRLGELALELLDPGP